MIANKKNLPKADKIDWAAVDAAPLADQPDDDSPELTDEQFQQLQPVSEILPDLDLGKQRITIMLDAAIITAYKAKAGGRGYQTLINETLRRGLEADSIKEALREVLREERAG
ncbi:MAG: BrnA antitoxin family protein [Methylococcales bacterium]